MRRGIGGIRALALLPVTAALLCFAAPASAYVYWDYGNTVGHTFIGRANLNGSGVDNTWVEIPPASNGTLGGCGMALNSSFLYWANCNGGQGADTIGRVAINGTGADNNFISGGSNECGVAVNPTNIFWAGDGLDQIGRANLDGTNPNQDFISDGRVCSVAVDSKYIYWEDYSTGDIGRANLDGTSPNTDFITASCGATGLAVNSQYIYWNNCTSIGRANINGTGVNQTFVSTGPNNPSGLAIDGSFIYWANYKGDTIGRANLNGTGVNPDFITTTSGLFGIAVNSLTSPTVTGLNPKSGPARGGTKVTITGAHLAGATEVLFGNKRASFTVVSNTEIIATSPPLPAGTIVAVRVITHAGRSPDSQTTSYKVRHNGA